jgi:colicin import membrane protein
MELVEQKQFAVAAYKPFYEQLDELEKSNTAIVFDYESTKGNKEARSHVYKLRQSKASLEKVRKDEKAESLRIGKAIDSEAKEIESRIEAMISVHQVEIDKIEQREKDRIDSINSRIEAINIHAENLESITSKELTLSISELEKITIDDSFQEFIADAAKAKDARIAKLRELLVVITDGENQAIELENLRKEAAIREQKDRDDAIAKAAAEKAIADAEAKSKAEREASERRELQLKLDAETAERKRIESEQKAESDKLVALKLAEDNRLKSIQDEKDRAEKERKDAEAEQAKREANKTHRATINRAALASLVAGGIDESIAKECISLIAKGLVDNVTINY